jgi:hypothetical protein
MSTPIRGVLKTSALFCSVFLLGAPVALNAGVLTLEALEADQQYQQTTNNPCIIGEPSCNQGAFPDPTILPAGADSYDALSPAYSVSLLRSFFGNDIIVGLDVNQTTVVQTLSLFQMLVNGVVIDEYSADPATPVPPTPGGGNGNGYADYLLKGFTSLAGFADTDQVTFRAVMPLVNDGREQFFLIQGEASQGEVPEPATTALVGIGLLGVGLWYRRRRAVS